MTTSKAETPSFACLSTGIPLPLSLTLTELFYLFLLVSSLIFFSSLLSKNLKRTNIRKPLLSSPFFNDLKRMKLSTFLAIQALVCI